MRRGVSSLEAFCRHRVASSAWGAPSLSDAVFRRSWSSARYDYAPALPFELGDGFLGQPAM